MDTSNLLDFSLPPAPVAPETVPASDVKKDKLLFDHSQEKEFAKNSSSTDDFEHLDDFMVGTKKSPVEDVKAKTLDFLAFEQSGDFMASVPPKEEKHEDLFSGEIQSDYLNPYNEVAAKKPQDDKEKFISSEDLLNDFKDVEEEEKVEEVKETKNLLDMTVYDDTAPIEAKKEPEAEPVKAPTPEPVLIAGT
jgi:hypothetical protein